MSWDQSLLTQIKQEVDLDSFLTSNDNKTTEGEKEVNKETDYDESNDFHESFNSALVEDLDTNEQVRIFRFKKKTFRFYSFNFKKR